MAAEDDYEYARSCKLAELIYYTATEGALRFQLPPRAVILALVTIAGVLSNRDGCEQDFDAAVDNHRRTSAAHAGRPPPEEPPANAKI